MGTPEDRHIKNARRLGFMLGEIVKEIGYDKDVDHDLRKGIKLLTGQDLVDEDADGAADRALLWFRAEDGDLVYTLLDTLELLQEDGDFWLLTPKPGQAGHIDLNDIQGAADLAGLAQTGLFSRAQKWTGIRLGAPQAKS
ncbi:DUF3052 domain-containing protein [Streptomyces minutiscleroticus]|uniref:DUF3052 domain-containing protein n=1 Tax=Streptomyces minutiscleroticus TaxID=68238 RepID=UPI00333322D4